jgi:hypothetical protein
MPENSIGLHANNFTLSKLLALPFQKRIGAFNGMLGPVIVGIILPLANDSQR